MSMILPFNMANAILNGMELSIDKFGRVVLPKKIREHLGVGLSLKVSVKETPEGILLQPVQQESGLMRKDGVLMFRGSGEQSQVDWRRQIEEDREERIQHILNP
jgi:bifunctional DNA-binding transcriptional regulator/antitoxin component of YhaV-PrlF toxin-antitoxin module